MTEHMETINAAVTLLWFGGTTLILSILSYEVFFGRDDDGGRS